MKQTKLNMFGLSVGLTMLVACSQNKPTETASEMREEVEQKKVEKPLNQAVTEKHEYLEIQLTNETGGLIDQTSVSFGSNQCTFGLLGGGGSGTYLGWTKAVGTNALVRWREAQKTARMATADFSKVYDPTKPGILSFSIVGTNVTVTFAPIDRK